MIALTNAPDVTSYSQLVGQTEKIKTQVGDNKNNLRSGSLRVRDNRSSDRVTGVLEEAEDDDYADGFDLNQSNNRREEIVLIRTQIERETEECEAKDSYTELLGESILALMSGDQPDFNHLTVSISSEAYRLSGSIDSSSFRSDE